MKSSNRYQIKKLSPKNRLAAIPSNYFLGGSYDSKGLEGERATEWCPVKIGIVPSTQYISDGPTASISRVFRISDLMCRLAWVSWCAVSFHSHLPNPVSR
jgi:hypothetical protein